MHNAARATAIAVTASLLGGCSVARYVGLASEPAGIVMGASAQTAATGSRPTPPSGRSGDDSLQLQLQGLAAVRPPAQSSTDLVPAAYAIPASIVPHPTTAPGALSLRGVLDGSERMAPTGPATYATPLPPPIATQETIGGTPLHAPEGPATTADGPIGLTSNAPAAQSSPGIPASEPLRPMVPLQPRRWEPPRRSAPTRIVPAALSPELSGAASKDAERKRKVSTEGGDGLSDQQIKDYF